MVLGGLNPLNELFQCQRKRWIWTVSGFGPSTKHCYRWRQGAVEEQTARQLSCACCLEHTKPGRMLHWHWLQRWPSNESSLQIHFFHRKNSSKSTELSTGTLGDVSEPSSAGQQWAAFSNPAQWAVVTCPQLHHAWQHLSPRCRAGGGVSSHLRSFEISLPVHQNRPCSSERAVNVADQAWKSSFSNN